MMPVGLLALCRRTVESRQGRIRTSQHVIGVLTHDMIQSTGMGSQRPQNLQDGFSEEGQSRAVIHGVVEDVERESRDSCLHEDAEIVAKIRARHA